MSPVDEGTPRGSAGSGPHGGRACFTATVRIVRVAGLVGAATVLVAGCGSPPVPQERVYACLGTAAPRPPSGDVHFTFQQQGVVVGSASGPVDGLYGADVPAGHVTTIEADDQYFGDVGVEGGEVAVDDEGRTQGYSSVTGPGCPDPGPVLVPPAEG